MNRTFNSKHHLPISERLKNIPGFFGIRLSEEPRYKVLDMEDEKEIREYESMTLASITISGSYEEAIREAYFRLSQYLFGENAKNLEMSMSTPIFEVQNQNSWTVSMLLPEGMNVSSAPTPKDHAIEIYEQAPQKVAVLWYTGGHDLERVYKKSAQLYGWLLTKANYAAQSDVKIAQYDSPSTLDFFRRNELHVDLAEVH